MTRNKDSKTRRNIEQRAIDQVAAKGTERKDEPLAVCERLGRATERVPEVNGLRARHRGIEKPLFDAGTARPRLPRITESAGTDGSGTLLTMTLSPVGAPAPCPPSRLDRAGLGLPDLMLLPGP